jgi:hypothetical protein
MHLLRGRQEAGPVRRHRREPKTSSPRPRRVRSSSTAKEHLFANATTDSARSHPGATIRTASHREAHLTALTQTRCTQKDCCAQAPYCGYSSFPTKEVPVDVPLYVPGVGPGLSPNVE